MRAFGLQGWVDVNLRLAAAPGPAASRVVVQVWEGRWRVIPYDVLPDWLKDNDYLLHGHRPPMPSFRACFKSIFRIHTETGNIWTHLLGAGASGVETRHCLAMGPQGWAQALLVALPMFRKRGMEKRALGKAGKHQASFALKRCCVPCRFCVVPVLGNPDHAAAQHVFHGSSPGEGGVWDVLPGSSALPQLLLALPHCLLSLGEGLADLFKVSQPKGLCSLTRGFGIQLLPLGKRCLLSLGKVH